jgi:hypothetical protein
MDKKIRNGDRKTIKQKDRKTERQKNKKIIRNVPTSSAKLHASISVLGIDDPNTLISLGIFNLEIN